MKRWNLRFRKRRSFLLVETLVAFVLVALSFSLFTTFDRNILTQRKKLLLQLQMYHLGHNLLIEVKEKLDQNNQLIPRLPEKMLFEKGALQKNPFGKGETIQKEVYIQKREKERFKEGRTFFLLEVEIKLTSRGLSGLKMTSLIPVEEASFY